MDDTIIIEEPIGCRSRSIEGNNLNDMISFVAGILFLFLCIYYTVKINRKIVKIIKNDILSYVITILNYVIMIILFVELLFFYYFLMRGLASISWLGGNILSYSITYFVTAILVLINYIKYINKTNDKKKLKKALLIWSVLTIVLYFIFLFVVPNFDYVYGKWC